MQRSRKTSAVNSSLASAASSAAVSSVIIASAVMPSEHMPEQIIYRPCDAAKACDISTDSVTLHIKKRPNLFPPKRGGRHEWDEEQFKRVCLVLSNLSYKARQAYMRQKPPEKLHI